MSARTKRKNAALATGATAGAEDKDVSEARANVAEQLRRIQTENKLRSNVDNIDRSNIDFSKLKGPIQFFTPKEYGDARTYHEMIAETASNKVMARLFRIVAVSFVPLTLLVFLGLLRDKIGVNFMFGNALLCMFTGYFIHLFSIFYSAVGCTFCCRNSNENSSDSSETDNDGNDGIDDDGRHLFRVYSINSMIPDNTSMSVCYRALMFKFQAITSISEFSAIQGGIAQTMLLIISSYSWVVLLCALAPEIHKHGFNILSINDIFELIGCFGLVIIGTFELDPWNKTMKKFHNTGAMIGSLTLFGFLHQQYVIAYNNNEFNDKNNINLFSFLDIPKRMWLPVTLTIIAVIAYIFWNYFSNKAHNYDPIKKNDGTIPNDKNELNNIRNTVTKISMGNVISEACVLYSGASSMCLWLMYFDKCHETNFCRI